MNTGIGSGLMEIALGLMGIALIGLIIGHARDTATVVESGGKTFNTLLNTVMLNGR